MTDWAPNLNIKVKNELPFNKLIVNRMLDKGPRPGTAHLPLIEEQRLMGEFDSLLDVRIGQNNVWAFATELQSCPLQVANT